MGRKKKRVNRSGIPDHILEDIARRLIPSILADFEDEAIQREFAEWQTAQKTTGKKST